MVKEHLLNIKRNTDFLYYVGKTYQAIENKEYVGIIIQQIVDEIESQCDDLLVKLEKSEDEINYEKASRLFEEAICPTKKKVSKKNYNYGKIYKKEREFTEAVKDAFREKDYDKYAKITAQALKFYNALKLDGAISSNVFWTLNNKLKWR